MLKINTCFYSHGTIEWYRYILWQSNVICWTDNHLRCHESLQLAFKMLIYLTHHIANNRAVYCFTRRHLFRGVSVLYMTLHAAFVFRLAGAVWTMKLWLFTTLDLQMPQHVVVIPVLFPAPRTRKCTWKLIFVDIFGTCVLRLWVRAYHNMVLHESL
jgi:hypothetical protein